MKRKHLLFVITFLLLSKISYGQELPSEAVRATPKYKAWENIGRVLAENINDHFPHDSVDLHTFAINIKFKLKNRKYEAEQVSVTDSVAYKFYPGLDTLFNKIDFTAFANPKNKIIIPVGVLWRNFNMPTRRQVILTGDLLKKLQNLFYFNPGDPSVFESIYLPPIMFNTGIGH